MRLLIFAVAALAFIVFSAFNIKQGKYSQDLVYQCTTSFEKYMEETWVSEKDAVYFKNSVLDSTLSIGEEHMIYEKFRVYCDTTKREGDKYYWAVQVRSCTYMDRKATYSLGTSAGKYPYKLGKQKSESHCKLTTFGAMLPVSPKTKTVWLKVENLGYAKVD